MKRPNFFLVGAPRCGTTAMASYLSQHPAVFMPRIKEPKFYCTDLAQRAVTSRLAYEALFQSATDRHLAIGEASTSYIYSQVAIKTLLEDQPRARLILMVRDPVIMAQSLHAQLYRFGVEDVPDFTHAWDLQAQRAAGSHVPRGCNDSKRLLYGRICSVGAQLERAYQHAAREQILVLPYDDFEGDPRAVYLRVLSFLRLSDDGRRSFERLNAGTGVKSYRVARALNQLATFWRNTGMPHGFGVGVRLVKLNARPQQKARLAVAHENALREFFDQDVRLLESLIARDLSHWRVSRKEASCSVSS